MIQKDAAALLVIDLQDNLLKKISVSEAIVAQTVKLIAFAHELDIPIVWTEQYPKGLGPTTESVAAALPDLSPLEKTSFGCFAAAGFAEALKETGRNQLLVAGIETHICVMQTVLPALEAGYEVYVVRDAVGSRQKSEWLAGLDRMARAGAELVTVEMAIFESVRQAGTPEFKKILPLVK